MYLVFKQDISCKRLCYTLTSGGNSTLGVLKRQFPGKQRTLLYPWLK